MRIRRASAGDLSAIPYVHVESWKSTYRGLLPDPLIDDLDEMGRVVQWQQWINQPDEGLFIYVAEAAEGSHPPIEGFAACGRSQSVPFCDGEVYAIYLLQSAQRKGLGRKLMAAAVSRLRNSGARSAGVVVLSTNPARRFYEVLGGTLFGEQDGDFRGHPCREAVYTWRDLAPLTNAAPHWNEWGSGHPVVLIHGWTCDGDYWRLQRESLQKEYRVITLDLPGHGASPPIAGDFTLDLCARSVADVMDRAGVPRAALIGHSLGGFIARRFAQLHPDRVTGLGIIDSPFSLATSSYFDEKARAFESVDGRDARIRAIDKMFSPGFDENRKQHILAEMLATPGPIASRMFRVMSHPAIADEPALHLPTLLIPAAGKAMGDDALLTGMFPKSEIRRLNCGHFVTFEKPLELSYHLHQFLQKLHQ
ncbi:MAG: alpha/beta fold hydrolase [Acidobacteria bacterium]|nr:alpha/beta fold hydrolase [Acidobacteriota bacterium]